MKLLLAPMEGVVDFILRDSLTGIGGIDQCVTEFMRVTDLLNPDHVFYRYCPELKSGSRTRWGTPVYYQILGSNLETMGTNALRAAELGAAGVDINFGCPAKKVNSHDGGASLLRTPCRVQDIVSAVRKAVPENIPVTAKIRLGFDDRSQCLENAKAAEEGGAQVLTVHARTKTDGYKPPAYWDWIARIREVVKIPVVANGEVWTVEDFHRCREVTGSEDVMIGRGALSNPFIFRQIKESVAEKEVQNQKWDEVWPLVPHFFHANLAYRTPEFAVARTKQWLKALSLKHEPGREAFDQLKILINPLEFQSALEKYQAL